MTQGIAIDAGPEPRDWLLAVGLGRALPKQLRVFLRGEVARHAPVHNADYGQECEGCGEAWYPTSPVPTCPFVAGLASALGYPGGGGADERARVRAEILACTCVENCAEDPATACYLSGQPHVHPRDPSGEFGLCPVHPERPGDAGGYPPPQTGDSERGTPA